MNKFFGIGWPKTGTKTLGECLKILGFNHESIRLDLVKDIQKGDLSRIMQIAQEKDSFEDWPWIILYKEMDRQFPGSKFILTHRDPNKQLHSYQNMLKTLDLPKDEWNAMRRTLYGLPFPDVTAEQLQQRYLHHNQEVREYFQNRPEDLLEIDWEAGDGWQELCAFINIPVPQVDLPHANRGIYKKSPIFERIKNFLSHISKKNYFSHNR
jgi:hypothetical protein